MTSKPLCIFVALKIADASLEKYGLNYIFLRFAFPFITVAAVSMFGTGATPAPIS